MKMIFRLIGIGVVVLTGFVMHPAIKQFLEIDSCLDEGGRWEYDIDSCKFLTDMAPEQLEFEDSASIRITRDTSQTILETKETYPDYVNRVVNNLQDSILIIPNYVIYGDFNGDGLQDFSSVVINQQNEQTGIVIIEQDSSIQYTIFGAGLEVDGMTDLSWIGVLEALPIGKVIAPIVVDSESGDIIGPDETKEFRLTGNGIALTVQEGHGGGIIFWNGSEYIWYHLD